MTHSISAIDGRYQSKVTELHEICSEYGLMKYRLMVEVAWLKQLKEAGVIPDVVSIDALTGLEDAYDEEMYARMKELEASVNHDVKVVEYVIREHTSEELWPWIHFALTSEDVNNIAYACMLKEARSVLSEFISESLLPQLHARALEWKAVSMLSRTHGQPATPTTMGKEWAVYFARFKEASERIDTVTIKGKCNGATGNFAAHSVAFPETDWIGLSDSFITSLGLANAPLTTQIENHDYQAVLMNELSVLCSIVVDLATDVWGYVSIGYFGQKLKEGEVGSSTMPHKVNPIDFENARGNAKIARGLARTLADELPISMWQRDLSDSTVQRNFGTVFGHTLLSLKNMSKGIEKLTIKEDVLASDLEASPEVLTEAVQTVLRKYGHADAYEQLKSLSRGQGITLEALHKFITTLAIDEKDKERLLALTPRAYTGVSEKLVDTFLG